MRKSIIVMAVIAASFVALVKCAENAEPPPYMAEAEQTQELNPDVLLVLGQDAIGKHLREPSSVQWETVEVTAEGAVCATFVARNGFGGFTRQSAVYNSGLTFWEADAWEAFCSGKSTVASL